MAAQSTRQADSHFGPFADSPPRGGPDFTLTFEQTILTLIPAAIFVLAVPVRLAYLIKSETRTKPNLIRLVKQVGHTIHFLEHCCPPVAHSSI